MFLEDYLQQLGLTEKEAKLYLATIELGSGKIQDIAKKAGVKRPTAYTVIEGLVEKGLISHTPGHRGKTYVAENPKKMASILKERERVLSEALPFLTRMYNPRKGKPEVTVYEGVDAMRQMYHDTLWNAKEVWFFSSVKKLEKIIPGLLDDWNDHVYKNNIPTRELINPEKQDIEYAKDVLKNKKAKQDIRVLDPNSPYKFISADNAIFDDTIIMSVFEEKLFTTVIKSQALADTLKVLFEGAWQTAIPIEKYLKIKNKTS